MSYNPGAFGYQGSNPQFLGGVGTTIATGVGSALIDRYLGGGRAQSTATLNPYVASEPTLEQLGAAQPKRRKRRRRRLLTCSDKADIAFLHGQLGGGQLGRAAISSLLSRRCG